MKNFVLNSPQNEGAPRSK